MYREGEFSFKKQYFDIYNIYLYYFHMILVNIYFTKESNLIHFFYFNLFFRLLQYDIIII